MQIPPSGIQHILLYHSLYCGFVTQTLEIRKHYIKHSVTVTGTEVCGVGDNVAVTTTFIVGATASTVEPMLPPPELSAGVNTSLGHSNQHTPFNPYILYI